MIRMDERPPDTTERRRKAEEIVRQHADQLADDLTAMSPDGARQTLHEARVLQVELEIQSEELRRARAELEAEQARYAALYDLAPVGDVTISEQGVILHANLTAASLLGVARNELVTQPISRFILEDDRHLYDCHRNQLGESGEPQTCELRMLKEDGTLFWAQMEATVAQVERGDPECRVVMSDITERRRMEEALRENHEVFSLFLRHSPIYAYIKAVTPTESRVLQASDNYRQMIGISGADMVGRTMAELFPAELAAKMTADDWAVVATGEVLTVDEDLNGRNYTSIKFPIVRGDTTLLAGYTLDITDRKRAEAALRESEERFRRVFEEGRLGMVMASVADGRFTEANGAFCEMLGYAEEELTQRSFEDVTHPEHRSRDVEAVKRLWEGQIPQYKTEKRYLRKDGETVWGSLTASLIRSTDGKPLYSLAMIEDITERKRAESEKARLEAQLQQAQKMESVGRLAGGVAHDFNNMLAVILGNAELALMGLEPEQPFYDHLMEIRVAASRSADLTRQLLAFARKQTVAPTVLDLNETVGAMLTMLRRLIGEDIDLLWRPGENLWRTKIDPFQIDQILANLCVNAQDAITGVGKVTIETENTTFGDAYCANHQGYVPGEYVRLAVSDDGCGMDQETRSHLFEPFFTTKAIGKGTGLGLSTVYGVVTQNHGFITVDSEADMGTTFAIYLPRDVVENEPARTKGAVDPTNRGHETILLVEDDPAVLNMTMGLLVGQGYTVLAAPSAVEAIRVAGERAAEIRLLMTDVVMPEMNGRDLATKLLALYPHLKRLFMSGQTADVIADHGVLDERVPFLQKPFSVHDLAAKVREVLDQS
jgi:PAS domain S-box-containing protein